MLNAYKNVGGSLAKGGKASSSGAEKKGENFDKVEFNFGQSMSAAKANIAAEVSAGASSARLGALQDAYDGDKLPVTPEQIAESIIG
jgi:hypothetical protein